MEKASRIVGGVAALAIGAISLIVYWTNSRANKLVDEGNAAVEAGNAYVAQAAALYKELFSEANLTAFPGNRDTYRDKANEAADLYTKAAAEFRTTAAKFDEAADKGVKKVVADYWKLKVATFQKLAEGHDVRRDIVNLLLDDSIKDIHALNEQLTALVAKVKALDKECDDLSEQAKKLEADNKSEFR